MKVVVVESPAKAKTINKYLGKDYEVIASFGHIRDLPPKDGSVLPDDDFAMTWDMDARGAKHLGEIAKALKGADGLILATDPDREGEAISWHVIEALTAKKALKGISVERVTFNAITKDAVKTAMSNPRQVDQPLVDAYLARRALDYLVGFTLSPVLWRKLPGSRSAGRVQSVALRLVCEREKDIEAFKPQEYWSVAALLKTQLNADVETRLVGADGVKITRLDIQTGEVAHDYRQALETAQFKVEGVEAKPAKRNPQPPFTTSTLQQEASRKMGIAPAIAMRIAQKLYEGIEIGGETVGLITYMRTDGVDMAPEAIEQTRKVIAKEFGNKHLPSSPRKYTSKAKNAQEAHEAIRPTDMTRHPKDVVKLLESDQARLYELIWLRTIASQMESAQFERTSVDIKAISGSRSFDLRATGQVVVFDGFLAVYQEGKDDEENEENRRLPPLKIGDTLSKQSVNAVQHFTEPPPRFSEASLVKRMEELGIGRPSTYASVLQVLQDRSYMRVEKKRLHAEDRGRLVTAFLENFFKRYVEYDFTASLEEKLDLVSSNDLNWKDVLRDFWRDFSAAVGETKDLRTTQVLDVLNEELGAHIFPEKADGSSPRACTACADGILSLKLGKFGAFIGCSNYPECRFTRQLAASSGDGAGEGDGENLGASGTKILGKDEQAGLDVSLRDGRFGAYVQLGEGEKPKRQSLPKHIRPSQVDLELALKLLSLPRHVADHPTTGNPITAAIGRFGAYVQHEKMYANLGAEDDVLEIGANRAIDLIVAKEQGKSEGGARRGGRVVDPGRVLGDDAETGKSIAVKAGRFGPYVTDGATNATIPKAMSQDEITLDEAIALIRARIASGAPVKKTAAKKPAVKKPVAKKAATKKAPAKKSESNEKKPVTRVRKSSAD